VREVFVDELAAEPAVVFFSEYLGAELSATVAVCDSGVAV
jgi:hypothetical protein